MKVLGITWTSIQNPIGLFQQWYIKSFGKSITVYIEQESISYLKSEINITIYNQYCPAMVLETPLIQREQFGNSYLLPAEGTQLLKIQLPSKIGDVSNNENNNKGITRVVV